MERFFIDPRRLRQKRQGPLGQHIEEFATQVSEQGYSRQCACRQLQLVAELSRWMGQQHGSYWTARGWALSDWGAELLRM